MNKLFFCILFISFLSCGDSKQSAPKETKDEEVHGKGNGEMKDGISDYTNNKESFMLTCHIDAANSLQPATDDQINSFCECAWDKTKGKYPGSVIANDSKLEKDPLLKECYEAAKKTK